MVVHHLVEVNGVSSNLVLLGISLEGGFYRHSTAILGGVVALLIGL
jgi:hypothetical protein